MNHSERTSVEGYKQGLIDLIVLMNDRTQENMDKAMDSSAALRRWNPEGASVNRVSDESLHRDIEKQLKSLLIRIENEIMSECKRKAWDIYAGPKTLTPEEEAEVKKLEKAEFYHLMDDATNTMHESWIKACECREKIKKIKGVYNSDDVKV